MLPLTQGSGHIKYLVFVWITHWWDAEYFVCVNKPTYFTRIHFCVSVALFGRSSGAFAKYVYLAALLFPPSKPRSLLISVFQAPGWPVLAVIPPAFSWVLGLNSGTYAYKSVLSWLSLPPAHLPFLVYTSVVATWKSHYYVMRISS